MDYTFSPFYTLSFHFTLVFSDYLIINKLHHNKNDSMLSKQRNIFIPINHDTFN